ncbi:MAG: DUF4215 domain-containing protein, partial [Phycisphaerales bacterium]|nr:DUF4215 domain-containing protein [Phycisphaerales bacterium]
KARSKIYTTNARGLINITPDVGFGDMSADVNAIQGLRYPYKPGKCTGAPTTACIDNTECVGTGPCILCPSAGACPPAEACGDNAVTGSEECDDGNRTEGDGCGPSCKNEVCGDGIVQFYYEECDDGNLLNGDGCTSGCVQEVICGNCRVDFGESCDDGNIVVGDGCSATCQWEGNAPVILTYPIDPPGTLPPYPPGTVILGTEIRIPAGPQRLWFEVRIAGWVPRLLRSWQVVYGREMLQGINASPPNPGVDLTPAVQSCTADTDCVAAISGIVCGSGTSRCRTGFCEAVFQNKCDTEWIFTGVSEVSFTSEPQIAFYGVAFAGQEIVDMGGEYYAGTLVIDVPASAAGTYQLTPWFGLLLLDENKCPIG